MLNSKNTKRINTLDGEEEIKMNLLTGKDYNTNRGNDEFVGGMGLGIPGLKPPSKKDKYEITKKNNADPNSDSYD